MRGQRSCCCVPRRAYNGCMNRSALRALSHNPLVQGLEDLIFPAHCAVCGELGAWLCDACGAAVLALGAAMPSRGPALPGIAVAASIVPHVGPARRVVHQFKYGGMRVLAAPLAALMLAAHLDLLAQADAIVPVPLHANRVRRRGYNQAVLLAHALGEGAHLPVALDALERTRDTRSQVGLTRAERHANVGDAFVARDWAPGSCVLLVDDVCTTGATLCACAAALRRAGATRILALTFARAIDTEAHGAAP